MKKSTIKPYVFLLITIVFLIAVAFITPAHTVTPALQNIVKDGVNNVDGLVGVYSVVASSNGAHVYVAGNNDDAVTVFSRDKTSGALAYVKSYFDNATFGLDGASSIAMSPDGIHLYVTGYFDDAVTVFSRDETSGALAYVQSIFDNDTLGLDGAKQVIVSPDGAHVYVTGTENDAVTVFSLSKTSGELKHIESIFDNKTIGLNGAGSVTVSPDGAHVYIGGYYDDAVTVFSRDATNGVLTFTEIVKE